MNLGRKLSALRLGIGQRVGALGALGVLGLLLVGGIYLAGQYAEVPLQRHVDDLEWTYHRFTDMNASLAQARQAEAAFMLAPGEAYAAQYRLALDKAEAEINETAGSPNFSDSARARARVMAAAVTTYAARTLEALDQHRTLGFNRENGLRGRLRSSVWLLEWAIEDIGDVNLTAALLALQVLQTDVVDRGDRQSEAALAAQVAALEAAAAALPLDPQARSTLADRLTDFRQDLINCNQARSALHDDVYVAGLAFEDARSAGEAALQLAAKESEQEHARLVDVRYRTTMLMRSAIVVVMLAVALLAWRIGRNIAHPLALVAALTRQLASGDVGLNILYTKRRDEIGDVARALAVFRDTIDMNRTATERIYRLAHHDALTGLANRTLLHERLGKAISHARRAGTSVIVLCLDLDGFKAVNDLHGHAAGDRLLREVAARLSGNTRETDIAARLGGDEFVVVQSCATAPGPAARALAERLSALLAEPYTLNSEGVQGHVTASIGAALFPGDGPTPAELLRNADTALYRAKAAGKNCSSFFRPEMDRDLRQRRAMEQDLQHAVARHELMLAWQPLVKTSGAGQVAGFEVLLRWQKPQTGLVPPDVFIPIAEACGAIHGIGEWVLREACAEAAGWLEPLGVAVNVSPVQVQLGEPFAQMVEQALADSGLAPSRLTLEVTEGVLIREADRVLMALRRLKLLGVHVALDDFGTGYSSLATLRAFPFDKIKIDRSFTSGLADNGQDAAIVRAVLGLARGLGLPVVAEGVETESQLLALQKERCEEVQGWLLGRPGPISSFAATVGVSSMRTEPTVDRPQLTPPLLNEPNGAPLTAQEAA